jgi:hypothetical protein
MRRGVSLAFGCGSSDTAYWGRLGTAVREIVADFSSKRTAVNKRLCTE